MLIVNVEITENDTILVTLGEFTDLELVPFDFSTGTLKAQVRANDGTLLVDFGNSDIIGTATGFITLQKEYGTYTATTGAHKYDVQWTTPDNDRFTIVGGSFTINPEVTTDP